jgi:hypothetical protein
MANRPDRGLARPTRPGRHLPLRLPEGTIPAKRDRNGSAVAVGEGGGPGRGGGDGPGRPRGHRAQGRFWQLVAASGRFLEGGPPPVSGSGHVGGRNDRSVRRAARPGQTAGRGDPFRSNRSKVDGVDRIGGSAGVRRPSGPGPSARRSSAERRAIPGARWPPRRGRGAAGAVGGSSPTGHRAEPGRWGSGDEPPGCAGRCSALLTLQNLRNPHPAGGSEGGVFLTAYEVESW